MIRLMLAIGLAGALWPIDENNETLGVRGVEISSIDLFHAANSVYTDVSSFCDRNVETCETGSQIVQSVSSNIMSRIEHVPAEQQVQAETISPNN
ncbi:MAG: DUF5330 domain-containing protein [Pseudomonadota bacterium]